MGDTAREDFEVRCDEAALALVYGMDNVSEASVEHSDAEEWGEDRDCPCWYWTGTLVLKTDMPEPLHGRQYRIPIYCDNPKALVSIGTSDWDGGDDHAAFYRYMWVEEVTAQPRQK